MLAIKTKRLFAAVAAATVAVLAQATLSVADDAQPDKCAAAELAAAGTMASSYAKCVAGSLRTAAAAVSSQCSTKASFRLTAAFADVKENNCSYVDPTAIAGYVQDANTAALDALGKLQGVASQCAAAKMKAGGQRVKDFLGCYAAAASRGTAIDPACITKVQAKFAKACARAEKKGDCQEADEGCVATAAVMDSSIADVVDTTAPSTIAANQSFLAPKIWGGDELTVLHGWTTWGYGTRDILVLADVNGDHMKDVVGFGDDGVWTALSVRTDFAPAHFVLAEFGYNRGWSVDKHLRLTADIDGDGKDDIVAFGDDGVWTALSTGSGFAAPHFVLADFGYNQGWRVDKHVRILADVNHDGLKDIVAFGDDGTWVALGQPAGGFGPATFVIANFGANQYWRVGTHVRTVADVNGDGNDDIVAFGDDGVWTALSAGNGWFEEPRYVLAEFGVKQGWLGDTYPRMMADIDHDGQKEIVGFGGHGVLVSRQAGDGWFYPAVYVSSEFGSDQWGSCKRSLANLNGDGYLDIVAQCGTSTSVISRALGSPLGFGAASSQLTFGEVDLFFYAIGDVDNDGKEDLVGLNSYFHDGSAHDNLYRHLVARSTDSPTPPPPAVPSNVRVSDATPTTLTVSWTSNTNDVRYFVLYSALDHKSYGSDVPRYVVTGLAPGTQYCFSVQTISWWGITDWSPQVCGRTAATPAGQQWVDLSIQQTFLSPQGYPDPGETLTFGWTECISGTKSPGAYTVKVYHDATEVYSVRRPAGLPIGCFYSESILITAQAGPHEIKVTIDTGNEVSEIIEGDSVNSSTYPYDAF